MKKKPNILFLMSDQHRFDFAGYEGNITRTPNLDWLAKPGASSDRAPAHGTAAHFTEDGEHAVMNYPPPKFPRVHSHKPSATTGGMVHPSSVSTKKHNKRRNRCRAVTSNLTN